MSKKDQTDRLTNDDVIRVVNRVLAQQAEMQKKINYLDKWVTYFQEVEKPVVRRPRK